MLAISDIEQMSIPERLQAMELLWSSITRAGNGVHSPAWHKEVLSARRAKVDSGEGHFLSISELRARLNQDHS